MKIGIEGFFQIGPEDLSQFEVEVEEEGVVGSRVHNVFEKSVVFLQSFGESIVRYDVCVPLGRYQDGRRPPGQYLVTGERRKQNRIFLVELLVETAGILLSHKRPVVACLPRLLVRHLLLIICEVVGRSDLHVENDEADEVYLFFLGH